MYQHPCDGCHVALVIAGDPADRLCPDCREASYESLAARLDPSYDRTVSNPWTRCWQVLRQVYCFTNPPCCWECGVDLPDADRGRRVWCRRCAQR